MTDHDVVVATPPAGDNDDGRLDQSIAEELVARARADGVDLVGPGGLLGDLTKQILETGLEVEMDEHLGYSKHDSAGRDGGNSRNGTPPSRKVLSRPVIVGFDEPSPSHHRNEIHLQETHPINLPAKSSMNGDQDPPTVQRLKLKCGSWSSDSWS